MHVELELLTYGFDVLETFLVIRACTADPDLYFVFDKRGGEFTKGADDAFECRGHLQIYVSTEACNERNEQKLDLHW